MLLSVPICTQNKLQSRFQHAALFKGAPSPHDYYKRFGDNFFCWICYLEIFEICQKWYLEHEAGFFGRNECLLARDQIVVGFVFHLSVLCTPDEGLIWLFFLTNGFGLFFQFIFIQLIGEIVINSAEVQTYCWWTFL